MGNKKLHGLEEYEIIANEVLRENPKCLINITEETVNAVESRYNEVVLDDEKER